MCFTDKSKTLKSSQIESISDSFTSEGSVAKQVSSQKTKALEKPKADAMVPKGGPKKIPSPKGIKPKIETKAKSPKTKK